MYHFNEGMIALPEEWQDVTINVLSEKKSEGSGLSFTIARDTPPWGMKFDEFAEQEIKRLQKQLPDFSEKERIELNINARDVKGAEFTWRSTHGKMHQIICFVDAVSIVLIFTATMQNELSAGQKETVLSLLQTLRLREK